MHEVSIASEILRVCQAEVERHGGGLLEAVRVDIGELSAVEPDLLVFAWAGLLADTPEEGAELSISWCPARQLCASCGEVEERQPGSWLRLCPHCDGPLSLEGGRELDVRDVTFRPTSEAV